MLVGMLVIPTQYRNRVDLNFPHSTAHSCKIYFS